MKARLVVDEPRPPDHSNKIHDIVKVAYANIAEQSQCHFQSASLVGWATVIVNQNASLHRLTLSNFNKYVTAFCAAADALKIAKLSPRSNLASQLLI